MRDFEIVIRRFLLIFLLPFFVLLVKHANGPAADFNLSALPFSFGMLCRLLSLVFTCVKSRIDANVLSLYKDVEEEEAILYTYCPFFFSRERERKLNVWKGFYRLKRGNVELYHSSWYTRKCSVQVIYSFYYIITVPCNHGRKTHKNVFRGFFLFFK